MRGFLAVSALEELDNIVRYLGGEAGSPYNLAGLGDLIAIATSKNSHHHELGRKLAREEIQSIEGEGIHSLKMVEKYNLFTKADFPLYNLIHKIVLSSRNVQKRIDLYIKDKYQ